MSKGGQGNGRQKKEKNNSHRNKAINKAPLSLSLGVGVRRFCFEAIAPTVRPSVTLVYPRRYFSGSRPTMSMMTLAILRSLFSRSRLEVAPGCSTIAARTPSTLRQPYLMGRGRREH